MKRTVLICDYCGNLFCRPLKEHVRSLKLGRKEFCSRLCQGKVGYVNLICEEAKRFDIAKWIKENNHKHDVSDKFSPFRYFFKRIRAQCKKKEEITDITLDYLANLWKEQEGKCVYTGTEMFLPINTNHYDKLTPEPHWASLDRIDSSKGYIIGNIQFVCLSINYAKSSFSDEQFKEFLAKIKRN